VRTKACSSNWTQRFAGLTRRTDQAKLAGVCAGLAEYFGWRINGVRFAMVALCCFLPPIGFGLYIALAVMLPQAGGPTGARYVPATAGAGFGPPPQPVGGFGFDAGAPTQGLGGGSMHDARERVRDLESRLREIEAYMTSSKYEFDREIRGR
jgi:phage shock protein C